LFSKTTTNRKKTIIRDSGKLPIRGGEFLLLNLALAVLVPVLGYLADVGVARLTVSGMSVIIGSLYFIKERTHRAMSFNRLTLVLIIAITLMAWMKKIPVPGFLPLSLAVLSTPLLDISYSKRRFFSVPFWFFTWWGIGEIFSLRYGHWGYMIAGVVGLIAWRDLSGKVQKAE
jgi:hypothetical protein